jgi:hypothetical protein
VSIHNHENVVCPCYILIVSVRRLVTGYLTSTATKKSVNEGAYCAASSHCFETALFAPFRSSISDFSVMFLMNGLHSDCKPTGLARLGLFPVITRGVASRVLRALGCFSGVIHQSVKH